MTIDEVNGIFIDLVIMYTNAISECDCYEVPDKNRAYMYIGTMIGLKEFRNAAARKIYLKSEQEKTNSEKTIRDDPELNFIKESEKNND